MTSLQDNEIMQRKGVVTIIYDDDMKDTTDFLGENQPDDVFQNTEIFESWPILRDGLPLHRQDLHHCFVMNDNKTLPSNTSYPSFHHTSGSSSKFGMLIRDLLLSSCRENDTPTEDSVGSISGNVYAHVGKSCCDPDRRSVCRFVPRFDLY